MKHDTIALIRVVLLVVLILAFVGFCIIESGSASTRADQDTETTAATTEDLEETTQEPQTTTEPTFTIPTQQETAPETEPPAIATEPPTEPPTPEVTEPPAATTVDPTGEWMSLGTYKLTAYCSCQKCCGKYGVNRPLDENGDPIVYTSIGAIAKAGTTIAVDPRVIPYGSEVKINGHIYIAQDTGGSINGNRIDVYFDDHQDALIFGVQYAEVFTKIN